MKDTLKVEKEIATGTHDIKIKNRKEIEVTGVKEIDSFDQEEFLLQTVMGYVIVRGEKLQLKTLNVQDGLVIIHGKIDDFSYMDDTKPQSAKSLFSKLFK